MKKKLSEQIRKRTEQLRLERQAAGLDCCLPPPVVSHPDEVMTRIKNAAAARP